MLPDQLVRVVAARGLVSIDVTDAGIVDVYLKVVNMTDRPLRVDDLHLELFYAGGVTTSVGQPLFRASEKPIPPFNARDVNVTIQLGSAAIREILQRLQKARNAFSSPGIVLTVGGKLDLFLPGSVLALQRAKMIRLPFTVAIQPELHINVPDAQP